MMYNAQDVPFGDDYQMLCDERHEEAIQETSNSQWR